MVIAEKPITAHSLHRDRLFSHSKEMIESGDRLQACEKIWSAVAHALKVVADRRGWSYESHVDALVIAAHVGRLTDDDRVELLFRRVQDLHGNFYADTLPMDAIKRTRADAQLLLKLLKQANRELPRDAPCPRTRATWSASAGGSGEPRRRQAGLRERE